MKRLHGEAVLFLDSYVRYEMNVFRNSLHALFACGVLLVSTAYAGPSYEVFGDTLNANGWSSQPWGASVSTATSPVFRGTRSAKVVYTSGMGVFKSVASGGFNTAGYTHFVFAVYNSSNADDLWLVAQTIGGVTGTYLRVADYADRWGTPQGVWTWVRIPVGHLGLGTTLTLSYVSIASGQANATAYFDDVGFMASSVLYEGMASTSASAHAYGPGIQFWSWNVGRSYYKNGTNYWMRIRPTVPWGGVQFQHRRGNLNTNDYGALAILWRQAKDLSGQKLHVSLTGVNGASMGVTVKLEEKYLPAGTVFEAGTWYHATIPMSAFGISSPYLGGVIIQSDTVQSFWVDDVRLVQKLSWMIPGVTRNVPPEAYRFGNHWLESYCDPGTNLNPKFHVGNDYTDMADSGRSIHVASRGFVAMKPVEQIDRATGQSWGWVVVLQHERGLTTNSLHLNQPSLSSGDEVQRGALLGTTKWLTSGSHLHFGLRLADFDSVVSQAGALPEVSCTIGSTIYPAFPDRFIDSQQMDW